MSYLIDSNVISELRKGEHCDRRVSAWYASIADEDLFLSTLVLGEIRKGRMSALGPVPVVDGLLAATASVHGLTLVTRKDRDVAGVGAMVLHPCTYSPSHRQS
ncbi:type II toxin-antitoxin system VapC family toxin [Methylacidimicrobium cyclopophantes]|uniref:type II toxin-antitoxin system VapC family toxin n=1 Tax=Methylacidimicrobium cyclopophantes TaxID=1041766 RepID=UPI001157E6A7|nr:type II toxin-antitoxin system VapC family toxin [Methylacidimicrobium cyclopophantes]